MRLVTFSTFLLSQEQLSLQCQGFSQPDQINLQYEKFYLNQLQFFLSDPCIPGVRSMGPSV